MNKIKVLKAGSKFIGTIGVGMIVRNIVKTTTPINMNIIQKVCIGVGGFALSGIIGDQAVDYIDKELDSAIKMVKESLDEIKVKIVKTK